MSLKGSNLKVKPEMKRYKKLDKRVEMDFESASAKGRT